VVVGSALVRLIEEHGQAGDLAAVVGALFQRVSDLRITITSGAPEWLFRLNLAAPFMYRSHALDVGVVQEDSIRLDPKVLGWLRKTAEKKGLPYQSLVNEILAEEMRKAS